MGVQVRVVLSSRWFPILLAVVQIVRHVVLLGFGYWSAMQHEERLDAGQFIRRDLARPLFEPSGFCGAWTHYDVFQSADFGFDLPAYLAAILLHSAIARQPACFDTFSTPRGQLIAAAFVPLVWFVFGSGIRRLARRQWRGKVAARFSRRLLLLCIIPATMLGWAALLMAAVGLIFSGAYVSVQMAGLAFWSLSAGAWAAERLRMWPFCGLPA